MQKPHWINRLFWLLPLCLYSMDANAWGLLTHVYFANSLLTAIPLLDKRLRAIIARFPEHVMAGACLPDLAVMSKKFKVTHQWSKAEQLLNSASTEEEAAFAIGYASHLYVDVIAHNHFVPAHEALWLNESIATHIASEWAMDGHIARKVAHTPRKLLFKYAKPMSHFIASSFDAASPRLIERTLIKLALADGLLRVVRLPNIIHFWLKLQRDDKHKHYDYYMEITMQALQEFNKVLEGQRPNWEPELEHRDAGHMMTWRSRCMEELFDDHALPIAYYSGIQAKYILEH